MRLLPLIGRAFAASSAGGAASGEPRKSDVWSEVAPTYSRTFARFTSLALEPLLDDAAIARGMRVLDLACGPGVASAAALLRGARVWGVDFASGMVTLARAAVPDAHIVRGDAHQLPWRAGSFDAVISNFGVHTFADSAQALREVRRTLRDGGTFAFTEWAAIECSEAERLLELAVRRHGGGPAPARQLTGFADPEIARRTLTEAGFTDVRSRPLDLRLRAADGLEIFETFRTGTIRVAKYLAEQPPGALAAIRETYLELLAPWRDALGVLVPIRAIAHVAHRN